MKKVIAILSVMVLLVCSLAAFGLSAAAVDSPSGEVQFTINHNSYNSGKLDAKKLPVKKGNAYELLLPSRITILPAGKLPRPTGRLPLRALITPLLPAV